MHRSLKVRRICGSWLVPFSVRPLTPTGWLMIGRQKELPRASLEARRDPDLNQAGEAADQ